MSGGGGSGGGGGRFRSGTQYQISCARSQVAVCFGGQEGGAVVQDDEIVYCVQVQAPSLQRATVFTPHVGMFEASQPPETQIQFPLSELQYRFPSQPGGFVGHDNA